MTDAAAEERVGLDDVELLSAPAVARGREAYVAGDLAAAARAFDEALAEDPGDWDALHGLAKAVRATEPARALEALERAVLLRPASFEAWRALASLRRDAGDREGLARAVDGARGAAPGDAAAAALALDFPA